MIGSRITATGLLTLGWWLRHPPRVRIGASPPLLGRKRERAEPGILWKVATGSPRMGMTVWPRALDVRSWA